MRFKFIVASILLLSGCSATGPTYSSLSLDKKPNNKMVKMIFYRPPSFGLGARVPNVEINGANTCELPNGSFFIKEIKQQNIIIKASLWDMPGTSQLGIKGKAGDEYYIRISTDGGKLASGVVAGFAGLLIAEGVSSRGGPFVIDLLDKQAALPELQSLKMSTTCQ